MKKSFSLKTKDLVLSAAIEEFIEFGYYGARMQRIADRAGVNKAMLFYYFSNKEQIYREALGDVFQTIMGRLGALGADSVPLEEKVRQIVSVYIDVFTAHPDYLRLAQYELITGGKNLPAIMQGRELPFTPSTGPIHAYFEEKVRSGEIRDVDIFQLIVSIIGQTVAPFMVRPMIEAMAAGIGRPLDFGKFIAERKEFIVRLVCDGIRKR